MQEIQKAILEATKSANSMAEDRDRSPVHAADAATYLASALRDVHTATMTAMSRVAQRTDDPINEGGTMDTIIEMLDMLNLKASISMGGAIRLCVLLAASDDNTFEQHHGQLLTHLECAKTSVTDAENLTVGFVLCPKGIQ
tara:strand:+ start:904 stop:1326 length:423 start_codon:yes stop_codon:yes gene_type:complete